MRALYVVFLFACILGCAVEERPTPEPSQGKPRIVVTFYPNEYIVQRIGGDSVEVFCDVPDEMDVLDWVPGDAELQRIRSADLIVLQGTSLECWFARADLPMSRVCIASEALDDRVLRLEAGTSHSHGSGVRHEAGEVDAHIWLDPLNTKQQAATILGHLQRLVPSEAASFETRFAELARDLDELSEALRSIAKRGEPLCASHPAYAYLASRFGFEIKSFDFDPAVMPEPAELAKLQASANESGASTILWESEPAPEIAARIESECGLRSLVYSPCELLDAEARARGDDYLSVQRANVSRLR